jgi:hypothetical protein
MKKITIALLDMYDGAPNQGMRCLIDIINRFSPLVSFDIYDVRKCELPKSINTIFIFRRRSRRSVSWRRAGTQNIMNLSMP